MQVETTYDQAAIRKYPEAVAIAIAKDPQGKHNPITLGWVMTTSHEPPMFAFSVGLTRYSLEAIRFAGQFVISYPSEAMAEESLLFGTQSGRDMDKIAESGAPTQPATKIDGVLLADAVANFECELEGEMVTGDHVIFVGRVVASHMNKDRAVQRVYTVGPSYEMAGVVKA